MSQEYTLQEQRELGLILDDFINLYEEDFLLLGEEIKYDLFSEAVTGGSVKRAVRDLDAKKGRIEKKASKVVDDVVDAKLDGERKREIKSIREDLLRGRGKVSTVIKRAFKVSLKACAVAVVSGGAAAAPALALIGFVLSTARRRNISRRERNQIIWELESELKILEEKIKDAEGDNDKKLKYQYMRLKMKLERELKQLKTTGKIQQRPRNNDNSDIKGGEE